MVNKTNKSVKHKTKRRRKCSQEEFAVISHMNSIYDEGHGTGRSILYGRSLEQRAFNAQ